MDAQPRWEQKLSVSTKPEPGYPPNTLLRVSGLKTQFSSSEGRIRAVDGIDFQIQAGEILGLVGESGCGKTATGLSLVRLIEPPGEILSGEVHLNGTELLSLPDSRLKDYRGQQISMIFQDPHARLNPVFTIGTQLSEIFEVHLDSSHREAWHLAEKLLERVGLRDTPNRMHAYPHQLSGGQAQRVMIAMAIALKPKLLIADEPTSTLDPTIQAQILELLTQLVKVQQTGMLLISHDLTVMAQVVDRIAVMYMGKIVEQAQADTFFNHPLHPYTQGLLKSIPVRGIRRRRLSTIPGNPPVHPFQAPGCRFAARCQAKTLYKLAICDDREPSLESVGPDREVRCWLYQDSDMHRAPLMASIGDPP